MPFNSVKFCIFMLAVFMLASLVKPRHRWILHLAASIFFYSLMSVWYLLLLVLSTGVDYFLAIRISTSNEAGKKKAMLLVCLIINIGLLFGFKYLNLFGSLFSSVLDLLGISASIPHLSIIIPVGISFFTFKKISYVMDVYWETIAPERNFGLFSLYVILFLEILSGPIDRAGSLIPQLKNPRKISQADLAQGFLLILWGFFMKIVVADRLAIYTDAIFNNVDHHFGPSLVLAAYLYTFQIFCDFAGYTNVAIGCGRLLGIDLMPNFNLPYLSKSTAEFWRRWHMSLSFWFRDYLYIPLGGNRVTTARRCSNVMIVFLLCGLWHGANWTFMIWGGIHGLYQAIGILTKNLRGRVVKSLNLPETLHHIIQMLITFHLVVFAWIFFRANNINDVFVFLSHLAEGWPKPFMDASSLSYGIMGVLVVAIVNILQFRGKLTLEAFMRYPTAIRWCCYYVLIFSLILCGVDGDSAFIYVQF